MHKPAPADHAIIHHMRKTRLAINGFGRIGRLFLRQAIERDEFEIIAINDLGSVENLAYLLQYDSVYGRAEINVKTKMAFGKSKLVVGGKEIMMFQEKDPIKLPWGDLRIDVVIESTGFFEEYSAARAHRESGAKHVVISAPAKDEDGPSGKTILMGVNEDESLDGVSITSNGSCTTNAASPVVAIMAEKIGIKKAILNTVHGYTATQNLNDGPTKGKDLRRGRAAGINIVPSTTGAAISVTRAIPALKDKFDGLAFRVPVASGSVADITFVAKRKTSVAEVNAILKKAASESRWKGILKTTEDQIVSSDIIGEPYAAIVDLNFTKVVDGDLVKVISWYDNEWGYVSTLVKHVQAVAKML